MTSLTAFQLVFSLLVFVSILVPLIVLYILYRKTDWSKGLEWISSIEVFRRGVILVISVILFSCFFAAYNNITISNPDNLTNDEEAIKVFMTTLSTFKTMFLYVFVYPSFLLIVYSIVQISTGIIRLRKQNKNTLESQFIKAIYNKKGSKVIEIYKLLIDKNVIVTKRGYDRVYPIKKKQLNLTESFYSYFLEIIVQENDRMIAGDLKTYPLIKKRLELKSAGNGN
jgi:hypothetical protein